MQLHLLDQDDRPIKMPMIVIMVPLSESETFINLLNLTPSSIGLSLSQATTMLGAIQWAVRQSSEAENYLTRLAKYNSMKRKYQQIRIVANW